MTPEQVIEIIRETTGHNVVGLAKKQKRKITYARYVAIMMLMEEGMKHPEISEALKCERSMPYKCFDAVDKMFNGAKTPANQEFKEMYLICIGKRAEMEDAA